MLKWCFIKHSKDLKYSKEIRIKSGETYYNFTMRFYIKCDDEYVLYNLNGPSIIKCSLRANKVYEHYYNLGLFIEEWNKKFYDR